MLFDIINCRIVQLYDHPVEGSRETHASKEAQTNGKLVGDQILI